MKEKLEQRLRALRGQFEQGQKMLADLDVKQADLRNTLLRISGAIQVLEEELGIANSSAGERTASSAPEQLDSASVS